MTKLTEQVRSTVIQWQGITEHDHSFGGIEFVLGKVEIGHLHHNGLADIPFTRKLRDQLILENKASPHHILPESGWISFLVRDDADARHAIWLFRLSFLHKLIVRKRGKSGSDTLSLQGELSQLKLSEGLQSALSSRLTQD